MKQVKQTATGANFTAVTVGDIDQLDEYTLPLGPGIELQGKVFAGNSLQATGAEISLQQFGPSKGIGFLHAHKTHEELYLIIRGAGEFQVDGTNFPIAEGSIVRVSPEGKRTLRNTGDKPLTMICIQYKADSFDSSDASDGEILREAIMW